LLCIVMHKQCFVLEAARCIHHMRRIGYDSGRCFTLAKRFLAQHSEDTYKTPPLQLLDEIRSCFDWIAPDVGRILGCVDEWNPVHYMVVVPQHALTDAGWSPRDMHAIFRELLRSHVWNCWNWQRVLTQLHGTVEPWWQPYTVTYCPRHARQPGQKVVPARWAVFQGKSVTRQQPWRSTEMLKRQDIGIQCVLTGTPQYGNVHSCSSAAFSA
jgi:hypothetical protein